MITRAEAAKVDFGLFHLGDTPKKARHDLEQRKAAQRGAPTKPSQQAKPIASADQPDRYAGVSAKPTVGGDPAAPKANATPAAFETGDPTATTPGMSRPQDPVDQSPFGRRNNLNPPLADEGAGALPSLAPQGPEVGAGDPTARRQSDTLLLGSRRALATGDVRRAMAMLEQAKALRVNYGFHEDNPAKVEASIRKYTDVMEVTKGRTDTESARQQYADMLMEQSQLLLRWKDFDEAERLAADAARLRPNYGPFEARPETLLDKIAAERKQSPNGGKPANTLAAPAQFPPGPANEINAQAPQSPQGAPGQPSPKDQAVELTRQARAALAAGNLDEADRLSRTAEGLRVPNSAFNPQDDRPWMVALEVQKARLRQGSNIPATAPTPNNPTGYPVTQTVYNRDRDATRNQAVNALQPLDEAPIQAAPNRLPAPREQIAAGEMTEAMSLFLQGEQALRDRNTALALESFRKAYERRAELDPGTLQRVQDHLQLLSAPQSPRSRPGADLLDSTADKQELLVRQISNEVAKAQQNARNIMQKDPNKAVDMLTEAKAAVDSSGVEPKARTEFNRRIDLTLAEINKYINENRDQIELDAQNKEVLSQVERRRKARVEVDAKLAKLVDEFNTLMEERREGEAEVVAKRARELDPDNPLVIQLIRTSQLARRVRNQQAISDEKEDLFVRSMESIEVSSMPFDDSKPYQFGDVKDWQALSTSPYRKVQNQTRRSERDLEIERKLKTPVSLKFRETALREVLDHLAKLAAINLHLDPQGLAEEGVQSDTPVTIDLPQDISLRSALNLILQPLHLSYVIKDEVLKITSEQLRDGEVYTVTYSVADLVIPIPNFVPSNNIGMQSALRDAYGNLGTAGAGGFSTVGPTAVMASQAGTNSHGVINPTVLAQMNQMNPGSGGPPQTGTPQNLGGFGGPGGMGGGAQADFDSLIELITSTIQPTTWDEVGGPGSIREFATNLSLVISQTQEVHEQIVDLLEQLRKLQDLQVTIEVRFITLNDNFFERIGVDFDFNIDDNVTVDPTLLDDQGPSVTVGLQPDGAFTADLDIPFNQDSFTLSNPQFGTPVDVATFGFAILSDIEAFFLIAAAQGDRRSNVLQAPKVTLFNGQQAFVSDTSQTPFVISVIPVVGDFAAAQQPVIVVLSEGTFLTVQAVVSNDRRFVRLTVVPFFSQIGDVQEFTFSGSTTTTHNTSEENSGDDTASSDDTTVSTEGITVQLPTFSFVTVTTTVSVPDGGTVLLGGIKRLSEGRNEFGVPLLSKLPYINRLFKNVGIGRETSSLMMMVTPRIIIQEEEEDRLGINPQTP